MARTASSANVSPKSIRKISSRFDTPSRSAPPKKIAKVATPAKTELISDELNPKVLLSKTLDHLSHFKFDKTPGKAGKTTAGKSTTSSAPKSKFLSMVTACIFKLQSRNGSSRAVILNQIKLDYPTAIGGNEANINLNLKLALKKGLAEGVLRMAKEFGKGSGSFKLTKKELKNHKVKTSKNSNEVKKVENDNTVENEIM
eukprot:GFUD01026427.1.p1 GENE.GFUD01026427.1~~GFUD01026427.1.p1  ORF type:complete len:200 (-),score=39.63 GFUD01026427.1:128-727(-)